MNHALLAYGGSQATAEEALFVAAYLNARYQVKLSVLSVGETIATNRALARVRQYLAEIRAEAEFYAVDGPVEEAILDTAVSSSLAVLVTALCARCFLAVRPIAFSQNTSVPF